MRRGGDPSSHVQKTPTKEGESSYPTIILPGDGDTTVHSRNGDRLLACLDTGNRNGSSPRVTTRRGRVPGGYEYTRLTYRDDEG